MSISAALARPIAFDWGGRVLKFGFQVQTAKADIEQSCRRHRMKRAVEFRGVVPDDILAGYVEAAKAEIDAGLHDTGSDNYEKFVKSEAGVEAIVSALLDAGGTPLAPSELRQLLLERGVEVAELAERIVRESSPKA